MSTTHGAFSHKALSRATPDNRRSVPPCGVPPRFAESGASRVGSYGERLVVVVADWFFGVQIPWGTRVGPRLRIAHGVGLVVNGRWVIGRNVTLREGVTLAGKRTGSDAPTLGDNVNIGADVTIVGPITIGDGARIGAGAVVVTDIPAGATAVGNPARVLTKKPDDRG